MNQTGWRFTMKEKVMGLVVGAMLLMVVAIGCSSEPEVVPVVPYEPEVSVVEPLDPAGYESYDWTAVGRADTEREAIHAAVAKARAELVQNCEWTRGTGVRVLQSYKQGDVHVALVRVNWQCPVEQEVETEPTVDVACTAYMLQQYLLQEAANNAPEPTVSV